MKPILPALCALTAACLTPFYMRTARSSEIHVDGSAKSAGKGSADAPFPTVQAGLDAAQPGDTVRVHSGTYVERVRFPRSGNKDAPIVLEGDAGAIIDGREKWSGTWEKAPEFGDGVWRAQPPCEPRYVAANGRIVYCFIESELKYQDERVDDAYKGLTLPRSPKEIFQKGAPFAGFKIVKGCWCYDGKYLYGKIEGQSFGEQTITIAPEDSACVAIEGVDHCVVRGLELRQAWEGVALRRTEGSVVEFCTVGPTMRGIRLDFGARNCIVRNCEVHCPAIFAWTGGGTGKECEDLYWLNKIVGDKNLRTISALNAGAGNVIAFNYIHDVYQGIEAKEDKSALSKKDQAEIGDAPTSVGLEVHHNSLANIWAYGLGPNGACVNERWHHNLVREAGEGMRIKKPKTGPLYIYRNVIVTKFGRAYWWFAAKDDPASAAIYMYHNTLEGPGRAVFMATEALETTPRAVVFGNILMMNQFWHQRQDPRKSGWEAWQCDGNLLWNSVQAEARKRSDFNAHGVTIEDGRLPYDDEFRPAPGSPAIDAADAGSYMRHIKEKGWPLPESGELPGFEHMAGKAPDLGAIESDPEGKLPKLFTTAGLPKSEKAGAANCPRGASR